MEIFLVVLLWWWCIVLGTLSAWKTNKIHLNTSGYSCAMPSGVAINFNTPKKMSTNGFLKKNSNNESFVMNSPDPYNPNPLYSVI